MDKIVSRTQIIAITNTTHKTCPAVLVYSYLSVTKVQVYGCFSHENVLFFHQRYQNPVAGSRGERNKARKYYALHTEKVIKCIDKAIIKNSWPLGLSQCSPEGLDLSLVERRLATLTQNPTLAPSLSALRTSAFRASKLRAPSESRPFKVIQGH